jgi:hypothetical protein
MTPGEIWTGGCQCGAVRYAISGRPINASICHCRMCQKHVGGPFGAFVEAGSKASDFTVTRGTLAKFRSSNLGSRLFCRDCGTPLGFQYDAQPAVVVTIGSLDRHAEIVPERQYGIESREAWTGHLGNIPETATDVLMGPEGYAAIQASNHQHPDHDTGVWPPPGA